MTIFFITRCRRFAPAGSPIRISMVLCLFAAPHGFSQLTTSFFGDQCHWHPPCALSRLIFSSSLLSLSAILPDSFKRSRSFSLASLAKFLSLCSFQGARSLKYLSILQNDTARKKHDPFRGFRRTRSSRVFLPGLSAVLDLGRSRGSRRALSLERR